VPKPRVDAREGTEIGIIAYGSTDPAIQEARDQLRKQGIETSYLQVRALPFEDTLRDFVSKHKRLYVVELNVEAQLRSLLRLEIPERSMDFLSVAHLDGLPLTARYVRKAILEMEQK
jgi:2-oxoglutarate ferredoxin oxidoreductase subunit alpha